MKKKVGCDDSTETTSSFLETGDHSITISVYEPSAESDISIKTPSPFLTHLLNNYCDYSNLPHSIQAEPKQNLLQHDLCEDVGTCLGASIRRFYSSRKTKAPGYGSSQLVVVESLVATTGNLLQNWKSLKILNHSSLPLHGAAEDLRIESLVAFFDGFTQGCEMELFIVLHAGDDPHHLWEAVFRSFGIMIRNITGV